MFMTPEKAFEGYRGLVENSDQAIPLLVYVQQDGEAIAIGLAIEGLPEGMGMAGALRGILPQMKEKLGRPKELIFHSEGWYKTAKSAEEWERLKASTSPGSYQREVDAGAQLAEAITISAVSFDESWTLVCPFVRHSPGSVTWDEHHLTPSLGEVPDALRDAILLP